MKLIQYTGPFRAGDHFSIPANKDYYYVHIGITVPPRDYIFHYLKKPFDVQVRVNGQDYHVSERGVLEFMGLAETAWEIEFLTDTPIESSIEISYKIEED